MAQEKMLCRALLALHRRREHFQHRYDDFSKLSKGSFSVQGGIDRSSTIVLKSIKTAEKLSSSLPPKKTEKNYASRGHRREG